MTSIDVSVFNRKSNRAHNEALNRQIFLPACDRMICITSGPTSRKVALAPLDEVDRDLAGLCRLFDTWAGNSSDLSKLIVQHMPIVFKLGPDDTPAAVFIRSIDFEPDRDQVPSLFQDFLGHQLGLTAMLIQGWYAIMPKRGQTGKKTVNGLKLAPCIISYDPQASGRGNGAKGYLVPVLEEQPLPQTQVVKDAEALQYLLNAHFKNGFMESHAPDGKVRWGCIACTYVSDPDYVSVWAKQEGVEIWRFTPDKYNLYLVGTTPYEIEKHPDSRKPPELMGDAILCSDGSILHTYYFSRTTFGRKSPADWHDGYYFNRFYPPGSSLVPEGVIESFNRDMPDWFRNELLTV